MYLCVVFAPFVGSLFAGLFGRYLGARGSGLLAVFGLGTAAIGALCIYLEVCLQGCIVSVDLGPWFSTGTLHVDWNLTFDPLCACRLLTVSMVSLCVHIYSIGYRMEDPHLPRFMSYRSLFTGFRLLLVSCSDLITRLIGWEGIGICSYLLIGFWFHRLSATKAAQKAILVNRVSDTILLLGLRISWWYLGSTDYAIRHTTSLSANYTTMLCFRLLGGALGKSAQIGLHTWLADAMEGPTTVSALIHAATLVTAGIYLIARTSYLWETSTTARTALVLVGALTSFTAASRGLVQNDRKRVIAYSTRSQLGYRMVALGLSHYALAMTHLRTHACFKALLFLGAGVVIHACHNVQDLRRQGGAHAALPWAWIIRLLGSLSLRGWPFLAGYYSKDAILERSWATPTAPGAYAYVVLRVVAVRTAAYSFRVLLAGFVLSSNARKPERPSTHVPYTMGVPLLILMIGTVAAGYRLSDPLLGWGSRFWQTSISVAPATSFVVDSHRIPVWASLLPLFAVFLGLALAIAFTWPRPWCAYPTIKALYLFAALRMHFDNIRNQYIAGPLLTLGAYTWAAVDKGILELLGPTGLSAAVVSWAVPSRRSWQTGTVQDYALVRKLSAIIGLISLVWISSGWRVDIVAFSIALLLVVLAP
uniref:NADH-ubiquinone oxidoreductase chain 5 n=1 Tax=Chromochloris zofingiensis TaxID=31302 RepID=A0A076VF26_9CHLO|nr:NADH dehydrogenase subunit 5 [Chromochloris zofingiensis]AIK29138.1 NADH dehydrogenase subunit 5 [Chromochloris zofingiensis]